MPQIREIYEDDSFVVEIRLDTKGQEINTVGTGLMLPDSLEVIDFSEGNSILSLWPEKPEIEKKSFDGAQDGQELSFIGGVPGGFTGEGLLLRITLKLITGQNVNDMKPEKVKLSLKEDSKVLLNDGEGTLAELVLLEGNYEVIQKPEELCEVSSKSHPEQDKWYNRNTLRLHWDLEEGTLYSYVLSYDPLAEPDNIADEPEGDLIWMGDMKYDGLEDGIYYFHLKQGKIDERQEVVWGPKTTFRAMIDTTPPGEFQLRVSQEESVFEGKYFLSFVTRDLNSGIDRYEVLEADRKGRIPGTKQKASWKIAESPYLLEDQNLKSKISVKAVDKAGNERIVEILPEVEPTPWWVIVVILAGVGVVLYLLKKLKVQSSKSKITV